MNFESPSQLKPRHNSSLAGGGSGSKSVTSSHSTRSNLSKKLEKELHSVGSSSVVDDDDDHGGGDDDSRSIVRESIKKMWRKRRKKFSSGRRNKESPENFMKLLNVAKILLLLFFITWNIDLYNKTKNVNLSTVDDGSSSGGSGSSSGSSSDEFVLLPPIDMVELGTRKQGLQNIQNIDLDIPLLATKPSRIINPSPSLVIPDNIDFSFQDVTSPLLETDVPVFWHILKSGGTTVKDLFGICMAKVEATEAGVLDGHIDDTTIQTVNYGSKIHYVNVDTTTKEGIERAINLNLVESGLADIIFTPLLYESSELFNKTPNNKGRMFGLFRHPIDRAVSLFHYLQKATWEPTYSERLKKIGSIEDYAISEFAENNWMIRHLIDKRTDMLSRRDLNTAKEIVRRKIVVGLVLDVRSAVERFLTTFGWDYNALDQEQRECMDAHLSTGGSNQNTHEALEEGSIGWKILRANNLLDLELYDYVLQLYEEQGIMLGVQ